MGRWSAYRVFEAAVLFPFLVAVQFLTRVPIRLRRPPTAQEIGRSLVAYPVVGLGIGAVLAAAGMAVAAVSPHLASAVPLRAVLLLCLWIALTGGLHLDGLADMVDAWAGGRGERERTLALMKDPQSGPMAIVALVLVLLLKAAGLVSMAGDHIEWLILPPLLGRLALPALLLSTPYVRAGGLGEALAAHLPRRACLVAVGLGGLAVLAIGRERGLLALALVGLVFVLLRRSMCRRIGGTTGDTAGAMVELCETTALLALS